MLFEIGLASKVSCKYIYKIRTLLLQLEINNFLTDYRILVQKKKKTLNVDSTHHTAQVYQM